MYMKANQCFICISFQMLVDILLHPTDLWMQTEKPNRLSCKSVQQLVVNKRPLDIQEQHKKSQVGIKKKVHL